MHVTDPFLNKDDHFDDEIDEETKELMLPQNVVRFIMADDPQEEMILHQRGRCHPSFSGFYTNQLTMHRKYLSTNPDEAMETRKKLRSSLAHLDGVRDLLSISQYEIATGVDLIYTPPNYRAEIFPRPEFTRTNADRLDGWVYCDPQKVNESNPLRHERWAEYWKTHDPESKKIGNPFRKDIQASDTSDKSLHVISSAVLRSHPSTMITRSQQRALDDHASRNVVENKAKLEDKANSKRSRAAFVDETPFNLRRSKRNKID